MSIGGWKYNTQWLINTIKYDNALLILLSNKSKAYFENIQIE